MIIKNDETLAFALVDLGRAMQLAGSALERIAQFSPWQLPPLFPVRDDNSESGRATDERSYALAAVPADSWPRIGGHEFVAAPPGSFRTSAYLAKYRPGTPRLIYVGACEGLRHLSKSINIPLNKVSTSEDGRLTKRLRELGRIRYGSLYIHDGNIIEESGFDKWKTYRPPARTIISDNSPVSIAGPTLRVVMPHDMTWRTFDARFDEIVQAGSIMPWFGSDVGAAHADRVGITPSYLNRFTERSRDGSIVNESAKELVRFQSDDFDRLVSIIEFVVLEHLALLPTTTQA